MRGIEKTKIAIGLMIIIAFALSLIFYNYVPDKMVVHWDMNANANGWMSKLYAMLLIPFLMIGISALLMIIIKIDPLRDNIEKFRAQYDEFIVALMIFLLIIQIYVIAYNIGINIQISAFMLILISVLMFFIGRVCINSKRNWFIGVRTPWTLQNDYVWNKTNKRVGVMYKWSAVIMLFGFFIPKYIFWLIIIIILIPAIYGFYYSYKLYEKKR